MYLPCPSYPAPFISLSVLLWRSLQYGPQVYALPSLPATWLFFWILFFSSPFLLPFPPFNSFVCLFVFLRWFALHCAALCHFCLFVVVVVDRASLRFFFHVADRIVVNHISLYLTKEQNKNNCASFCVFILRFERDRERERERERERRRSWQCM